MVWALLRTAIVGLVFLMGVAAAETGREDMRATCTRQAAEAGLTNQGDIQEYVAECLSLLSQNNEPSQDSEAQGAAAAPIQN